MLTKWMTPLLLSLGVLPLCAQDFQVGKWTLGIAGSKISLSYGNRTVVSSIAVGAFTPNYKARRFDLSGATMTREGDNFIWSKKTDQANARLAIGFAGRKATIDLLVQAQPAGPFEFGIQMPMKSFATADGLVFCRTDGRILPIHEDSVFRSLHTALCTFDLVEQRHTLRNIGGKPPLSLQDRRRKSGGDVCYITAMPVDESKELAVSLTWEVEEFGGDELAARRYMLKTPTKRILPVEVANAGFEDGLRGWESPASGSADNSVAHSGKNSARLTVNDPMVDGVYITRQVPVTGGASYTAECQVKIENVAPAAGKKSSVGAGLIVEWADKTGRWIAAGEYSCDLYGTKDWQQASCNHLRAPEDAGYAIFFLTLRGKGVAWFDDIVLKQIERSVDKLTPAMASSQTTNTPVFTWHPIVGIAGYNVDLSPDSSFPAERTRTYQAGTDPQFQLREPLAPGVWFWRVWGAGYPDIQPWSFTQVVAVDKDCLPPTIVTRAVRVEHPDAMVEVLVSDNGGSAPEGTAVLADGKPVRITRTVPQGRGNYQFMLQADTGWANGLNQITVTAVDGSRNSVSKRIWVLCARKPENAVVIDQDSSYSENGEKIFPFGIYEVVASDMPRIRKAGFDVVHTYRWESSQDDAAARLYLDQCWENGLRAFIGFDRGKATGKGVVQGNFEHIARRVGELADHPGLFCWYLFDEPEIVSQYVAPGLLIDLAHLIRLLDPYHPVVVTTWGNGMNKYRQSWDTHWTQSYHTPARIVKTIASHRSLLLNASPITLLIHCYDKAQSKQWAQGLPVDTDRFSPDGDWMRAAAYVGVVKEVNGLWWWWYASQQKRVYTVAHDPQAWSKLCSVLAELRELRPVLLAPGETHSGTVQVGDDGTIEWWCKTVADKQTFIAVNTSEKEISAELPVPGRAPAKLTFGRYEVKTLRD